MYGRINVSKRILFLGSKKLGLSVFEILCETVRGRVVGCATIDDRSDPRTVFYEIAERCETYGIDCIVVGKDRNLIQVFQDKRPDLCIVVGWYNMISKDAIDIVPNGIIGVHNSLLPAYRGQAPLVWQMINGESRIGYSVFEITEGMDEGRLYYQEEINVEKDDYIGDVLSKIEKSVNAFFKKNLFGIVDGTIIPVQQSNNGVSYGGKRCSHDGQIRWDMASEDVYNFIRAQSKPYPGAFSYYEGNKITIWRARMYPNKVFGEPGQVILIDKTNEECVVACGNNTAMIIGDIEYLDKEVRLSKLIKKLTVKFQYIDNLCV